MTAIYSKIFWWDLFYDFNIFIYERMYFALSFTFFFLKKKFGYYLNSLEYFGYFYVQIYDNVFLFPLKSLKRDFSSMHFYSLFWLLFLFMHDNYLERRRNFKFVHSYYLWNLLIYVIFKGIILFGFKSNLVVSGFWPKYLFTPEKIFNVIMQDAKLYKNPKFVFASKFYYDDFEQTNNITSFFKKKKKSFFTTFFFFKNSIFFSVSNLIKIFYPLKNYLYTVFFIRKQKFFNKGRYSRNRQLYRTGVYWCIYVNLLAVLGLNYLFYKFTINFLAYWWFSFFVICLFIFPYFFKSSFIAYVKNCCSFIYYIPSFLSINDRFFYFVDECLVVFENFYLDYIYYTFN